MGQLIYSENEPAVFRSFYLGVTTKDTIGVSYDKNKNKIWTRQTVVPIIHKNNVVATLILEKVLDLNSSVEPIVSLQSFPDIEKINEILISIFGFNSENEDLQIREGILIFDAKGLLKYFNQRAIKIYQEFGYKSIKNQHFYNLNYSSKNFDDIISNVNDSFNTENHSHFVIEKSFE